MLILDESSPFETALAYAFPTSGTDSATLTFRLLDTAGNPVTGLTSQSVLAPNTHESKFVWQLFGFSSSDDLGDQVGRLEVTSDIAVALVSLRFAGSLFTSVPPFTIE